MNSTYREQLRFAIIFLTRVPLRLRRPTSPRDLGRAVWAFPVVGIGVGIATALAYLIAERLGLPPFLAAVLAVTAQSLLTGALHDDAVADVADGFGGGRDKAAKLEIMRDSRVGSYGALALFLALAARIGAIAALGPSGALFAALIGAGAVSRAGIAGMMAVLGPARRDGLGADAGTLAPNRLHVPLGIAAVVAVAGLGWWPGLAALAVTAAVLWLFASLARRQVGGQTGDILGTSQQIAEIAFLLAAVASR